MGALLWFIKSLGIFGPTSPVLKNTIIPYPFGAIREGICLPLTSTVFVETQPNFQDPEILAKKLDWRSRIAKIWTVAPPGGQESPFGQGVFKCLSRAFLRPKKACQRLHRQANIARCHHALKRKVAPVPSREK